MSDTKTGSPPSSPGPSSPGPSPDRLVDVQGKADARKVAIDRVGVKHVRYPISLATPEGGEHSGPRQHTVARIDMYVSLPHHQKGTHMSRFLEVLNEHHDGLPSHDVMNLARAIRERLEAQDAHLRLEFPYFIDKKAPVTGQPGKLDIEVVLEAHASAKEPVRDAPIGPASPGFTMTIRVPATSLCPCSKEISAYGAHNQRCEMEASVRFAPGKRMWIEDLFAIVERCASTQVFSTLKRPDEKYVTEAAYDNPKFVEDIVRDLAMAMEADDRIAWYRVGSENFESIHSHNAYAQLEHTKQTHPSQSR